MRDTPPMAWVSGHFEELCAATQFLTRLPVYRLCNPARGALAGTVWAFPLVGMLVGGVGGALFAGAAALGISTALAAVLAVAGQVLLTGGLHEDAAADLADGFGGGGSKEAKLRIMRDSRIGTFGVLAVVLLLIGRIAALAALADPLLVLAALVGGGALSRAFMAVVMTVLPAARSDGLGAAAGRPDRRRTVTGLVIGCGAALLMLGLIAGTVGLLAGAAAAAAIGGLARRQIGGHTGDVLGACQQAAEIAALIAWVAVTGI